MVMRVFRVTEVFGRYLSEHIPERRLAYASERGIIAHDLCFKKARKQFVPKTNPESWLFFRSFEKWFDTFVEKVLFIEPEFLDSTFSFVGHPDLGVVLRNGEEVLIDLKTPVSHKKIWAGQCAAYLHLAQKNGYDKMQRSGSLMLDQFGGMPKMNWYIYHAYDFAAFISLLNGVRYFFE